MPQAVVVRRAWGILVQYYSILKACSILKMDRVTQNEYILSFPAHPNYKKYTLTSRKGLVSLHQGMTNSKLASLRRLLQPELL